MRYGHARRRENVSKMVFILDVETEKKGREWSDYIVCCGDLDNMTCWGVDRRKV